jgi:transcriptional regulator GlxA family with amidase domain
MPFDDLPVTASFGMRVAPTSTLSGLDEYDHVVLAGGLLDEVLEVPEWISALVRTLHLGGKPLIAFSCASFLLAEAGLP